jgi:hypothetical protein
VGLIKRNRLLCSLLVLGLVSTAASQNPTQVSLKRLWRPAVYHDLKLGSATKGDVERKLGLSSSCAYEESDRHPLVCNYPVKAELNGDLRIYFVKDRLIGVVLEYPTSNREETLRFFGGKFIQVRYSWDMCCDNTDCPLYLEPKGDVITLQDPSRGMLIWLNDEKKEKVDRITFEPRPIDVVQQSSCKTKKSKQQPSK